MAGTLTHSRVPQGPARFARLLPAMSAWLCVGFCAGLSVLALAWLLPRGDQSEPGADAVPLPQAEARLAQKASVISSGVVQAIRELPAEGASRARQFEMTIRMRDGTMRISHESGSARWLAGDAVRFIGSPAIH
jgi:hypothetical protein